MTVSRQEIRRGRPCGGSARRRCRRGPRTAASRRTIATLAIAPPVVSVSSPTGSRGRFARSTHVVLGAGDDGEHGGGERDQQADRPHADALARAVEARHAPGDVAAAVVGDGEHDEQRDGAAERRASRRGVVGGVGGRLGEADGRAGGREDAGRAATATPTATSQPKKAAPQLMPPYSSRWRARTRCIVSRVTVPRRVGGGALARAGRPRSVTGRSSAVVTAALTIAVDGGRGGPVVGRGSCGS